MVLSPPESLPSTEPTSCCADEAEKPKVSEVRKGTSSSLSWSTASNIITSLIHAEQQGDSLSPISVCKQPWTKLQKGLCFHIEMFTMPEVQPMQRLGHSGPSYFPVAISGRKRSQSPEFEGPSLISLAASTRHCPQRTCHALIRGSSCCTSPTTRHTQAVTWEHTLSTPHITVHLLTPHVSVTSRPARTGEKRGGDPQQPWMEQSEYRPSRTWVSRPQVNWNPF